MKRFMILALVAILGVMGTSCGEEKSSVQMRPEASQMKSICELAVMDCYYHNVAKFEKEDAEGFLWWQKDKKFWIEYSGIVRLGIDATLVEVRVDDELVTIKIPPAKVLDCEVNSASLNEDSYIVDIDSARISAEDEVRAFEEAQRQLKENASKNSALLAEAQQRTQSLLEDYVTNIGNAVGIDYSIDWIFLESDGADQDASSSDVSSSDSESSAEDESASSTG